MTISNTELRKSAAHILKCVDPDSDYRCGVHSLIADPSVRKDMIALARGVMRLTEPRAESASNMELRALAVAALNEDLEHIASVLLPWAVDRPMCAFVMKATPATILRLLDENAALVKERDRLLKILYDHGWTNRG